MPASDVTSLDGIPVTTAARTLLDVASQAPLDVIEDALDDAIRRDLLSRAGLRRRTDELGRRAGVPAVRRLLAAREPGKRSESVLEARLHRVLTRSGLRAPVVQHPLRGAGRVVGIVDLAYPWARLAIEADGYRWHSGRRRFEHDRIRLNALTLLGWRVIRVTSSELKERADHVVGTIRAALEKRAPRLPGIHLEDPRRR